MTGEALKSHVSAREREGCRTVIESGRGPCRRRVTSDTVVVEVVCRVVRVGHRRKVSRMTRVTRG